MNPLLKTLIVFFVILLIVAFATNPAADDFERFLKQHINKELNINDNDGSFNWLLNSIVSYGAQSITYHQDFKFFSLFTIELPGDQDYKFLGIFTVFIPLQVISDRLSDKEIFTFIYKYRYMLISMLFAIALVILFLFRKTIFYEEG